MTALTHGEFIEKLDRYKPIAAKRGAGASWAELAKEFALPTPAAASCVVRCYNRHQSTPRLAALNELTNASVMKAIKVIPFSTIEDLRAQLIKQFSASVGCSRQYPKAPKRAAKILLKASGLEWFEKDGRPYVHWKHDREAVAA